MNCKPCLTKCSYCCGQHPLANPNFVRISLVSFLSIKVFFLGPVPVAQLIKCLGNNKSKIFTTPAYIWTPVSPLSSLLCVIIYLNSGLEDLNGISRIRHESAAHNTLINYLPYSNMYFYSFEFKISIVELQISTVELIISKVNYYFYPPLIQFTISSY